MHPIPMHRWLEQQERLGLEAPALMVGVAMLIGSALALSHSLLWFFPAFLLLFPLLFLSVRRPPLQTWVLLALILCTAGYARMRYPTIDLPEEGVVGRALLCVDAPSKVTRHYGVFMRYPARLIAFYPDDESPPIACDYPLVVERGAAAPRLSSSCSYEVEGRLMLSERYPCSFRPKSSTEWRVNATHWSLGDLRFAARQWVEGYIRSSVSDEKSATFLTGLATGEFDDQIMVMEFSRFGLQHILAISGFHFSLVAGMLAFFLRLLFPRKWVVLLLMFAMSSYFLFIGLKPSVMRAWITVLVGLGALWSGRRALPLNSLGVALSLVLLYDPIIVTQVGFQFSFLATAAILLLKKPFELLLIQLSPKRTLAQVRYWSAAEKHAYLILQWIKEAVAASLAVHLLTVPYLLSLFHTFPLMSLFYNLFFPFLISLSLFLLLVGTFLPFLHPVNSIYTSFLLNSLYQMPPWADISWRCRELSPVFLAGYLSLILFVSLHFHVARSGR